MDQLLKDFNVFWEIVIDILYKKIKIKMILLKIKDGLGMTGEISLRGYVLPIGGLKEKSTAAHRAGLKHILVPAQNEKDLEDIPEKVLKDLKISFVKDVSEVLKLSLGLENKKVSKPRKSQTIISAEA